MQKTPNYDKKLQVILDSLEVGQERECSVTGKKWKLDKKEIALCKKFRVPPSTVKPGTRMNMLNGYNTGLAVFWNTDAMSGKPIISAIHPDLPFKVVEDVEWHRNDYSCHNLEHDPNKKIFDHIWELAKVIPFKSKRNRQMDDKSIGVGNLKAVESYMVCGSIAIRSFYTYAVVNAEDSIDVVNGLNMIRSYSVTGSYQISDSEYVFESKDCLKCSFIFDCRNCEFCFGATNKRNKRYIWFNEQLTKDEWEKRRAEINLSCTEISQKYLEKFYELWRKDAVWPQGFSIANEDCFGEHVTDSVRCHESYWQEKCNDAYRSRYCVEMNDVAYVSGAGWGTRCYMIAGDTSGADNKFTMASNSGVGLEYCMVCDDCQNCFGCVGLSKKRFYIFNKAYSEEEYWRVLDEVKCAMLESGEYGDFFPGKFSLSGFEHSTGAVYYGYREHDLERFGALRVNAKNGLVLAPRKDEKLALPAALIPDCLDKIEAAGYVQVPIHDKHLDRDYSVLKREFEIYKQKQWPFPRRHFIYRLTDLIRHSNMPFAEETKCGKCEKEMRTFKNQKFSHDRVVYCMPCYYEFIEANG